MRDVASCSTALGLLVDQCGCCPQHVFVLGRSQSQAWANAILMVIVCGLRAPLQTGIEQPVANNTTNQSLGHITHHITHMPGLQKSLPGSTCQYPALCLQLHQSQRPGAHNPRSLQPPPCTCVNTPLVPALGWVWSRKEGGLVLHTYRAATPRTASALASLAYFLVPTCVPPFLHTLGPCCRLITSWPCCNMARVCTSSTWRPSRATCSTSCC